MPSADLDEQLARLGAGLGKKHRRAATHGFRFKALEPRIQARERTVADRRALPAQRFEELRAELGHRLGAKRREPRGLEFAQVRLQGRVGECLPRPCLEVH